MKFKFFIFLMAISASLRAQTDAARDEVARKSIEPKSPVAESLGAFGGDKINNFVGLPIVEIPIYNVKLKGLDIPIKLKYDNSGIKVRQEASWVGLGWSLDFGGVISRQVRNFPDDIWKKNFISNVEYGYLLDQGAGVAYFSDQGASADLIGKRLRKVQGLLLEPSPGSNGLWSVANSTNGFGTKSDTQPDIFTFKVAGGNGKFVFGPDQKANLLNYEPYKIEYVLDNSGNPAWLYNGNDPYTSKGITSFVITDSKGNKFTFSDLETAKFYTNGFRPQTFCDYGASSAFTFEGFITYTTGWYITKIESAAGELVQFNYENETINSYEVESSVRNMNVGSFWYGRTESRLLSVSKRLASIETPYETITFVPGATRIDLPGSLLLSDIQAVSKADNRLLKQVHFTTGYFQGDISKTDGSSYFNQYYGNPYFRLKLIGVRTTVPGEVSISKYDFSYVNEAALFPSKFSAEQDFWGYYNANNNVVNTTTAMIPKIFISPDLTGADRFSVLQFKDLSDPQYYVLDGVDRSCNPSTVANGSLEKITYPTGGYSVYEYEPHDFMYRGRKFFGGGLRVKKITDYDGISHTNDLIRNYSYVQSADPSKSSGIIFDLPVFAYKENDCAGVNATSGTPVDFPNETYNNFKANTLVLSNPRHITGLGDQIVVGYSEIKESSNGNGYTWTKYTTPVTYGAIDDSSSNGCPLSQAGCYGLYTVPIAKTAVLTYLSALHPVYTLPNFATQDISKNTFPFIANSNYDWSRGLILNTRVYGEDNVLRREISYSYNLFTPESGIKMIKGLFITPGRNFNIKPQNISTNDNYVSLLAYYNNYNIITNVSKVPTEMIQTDYFAGSNPISITKSFDYSIRKFLKSSSITDSRGRIHKTTYRYPFDFDVRPSSILGPINPISYLVAQNIISDPVETTSSIISGGGEMITGSNVINYTQSSFSKIVPFTNAHLSISVPILKNDYTPAYIEWDETHEVLNQDNRMRAKISYDRFDERSNILQYTQYPDIYNAVIWGYNKYYVIATVANAKYSDVFHENFEESTDPNLSPSGNSKTGRFSKMNGYNKNITGLTNQLYKLTYWRKNGSTWELVSNDVNVTANSYNIVINNTYQVDDICFYPANAQMSTYTYEPLVGITSATDTKNLITYYEYDQFQRLSNIKDAEGNIIKHTDYNYKNQ